MVRGTHEDDDEKLTFITLQAATRNVTRYLGLDKQNDEHTDKEGSSSDEEKKRVLERLEFVNRRLRDLRSFEDRARGKRKV